jgi:hypothetical protein
MKNIHVLPTDKPSRLCINYKNNLCLSQSDLPYGKSSECKTSPHNIYITSDEEIKAKEYILIIREGLLIGKLGEVVLIDSTKEYRTEYTRMNGTKGWFASDVNYQKDWNYKKIILTTDQELISNGVQAIDDEFLEWFVKNPSCESVKVAKEMYMPQSNGKISDGRISHELSLNPSDNTLPFYKIIIPQEEPKPIHKFNNGRGATLCGKCGVIISEGITEELYCEKCKQKQETIEEAAERILANDIDGLKELLNDDEMFYFYKGVVLCYGEAMAEWQLNQTKELEKL